MHFKRRTVQGNPVLGEFKWKSNLGDACQNRFGIEQLRIELDGFKCRYVRARMFEPFNCSGECLQIVSHPPSRVINADDIAGLDNINTPRVGERWPDEILEQWCVLGTENMVTLSKQTPCA